MSAVTTSTEIVSLWTMWRNVSVSSLFSTPCCAGGFGRYTPKTALKCVQNPKRNPREEPYVRQPKILLPELKENYFDDDSIVLLESMQDGVLYSNILLKLYLKSLKHGTLPMPMAVTRMFS